MSEKCEKCGSVLSKTKIDFYVAKEDAFGFLIFAIALAAPVGFLTFIWRLIEDSLPIGTSFILLAYSIYKNKKIYIYMYIVILLVFEMINFLWFYFYSVSEQGYNFLSPEVAFVLAFYSIGYGIYRFFSLFVDYRISVKSKCLGCNQETLALELPRK